MSLRIIKEFQMNAQIMQWIITASCRGVAWALAAKLGYTAVQANDTATQLCAALSTLVLIGGSIYSSIQSRRTIRDKAMAVPQKNPR
jgi:hypothetical protein